MKVDIYQMGNHPDNAPYIFESYEAVMHRSNGVFPTELYGHVYSEDLDVSDPEEIFAIFNLARPKDYTGRSLSVSDIVMFEHQDGSKEAFYCNPIGFKKISLDPSELPHSVDTNI